MYYNHQYNYISPTQNCLPIKKIKAKEVRSTLNQLGFVLFVSELVFILLSLFGQKTLLSKPLISVSFYIDNFLAINEFWHGINLFISLFVVGAFYCLISNTKLNTIIMFKKVKPVKMIGYVFLGLGIAYIGNILTSLLLGNMELIGITNNQNLSNIETNTFTFIVTTFITAVTPAFAEEFLFRGVILGKLRPYGDGFALIISSVLFALMHCNIGQIPFAFIGGTIFGFVTIKTNSMLPAMIIHGLNNLISCFMSELSAIDNQLLSSLLPNIIFAIMLFLGIIGFILLIKSDMLLFKFENEFKKSDFPLTMKRLMGCFFSNVGMIFALIIFTIETISRTNFAWIS